MHVGRMYWRRKIIRCKYDALSVRAKPNRTTKNSLNSLVPEFRRWIKLKDCGTIRVSVRRRSSATNVVVPHSAMSF